MDSIVAAIGEMFGPVAGLILALAVGLGGAAMWLQGGALQEPGRDRDRLLRSLEVGGDLRQLYVFWLTRALNRVDRLLGDSDKAAFSLPSPFGNREPAPYWTGWSFDVCALLALVYPLLGVFAAWVWTGDAGSVGRGLGLLAATPLARRITAVSGLAIAAFVIRRPVPISGWLSAVWLAVTVSAAGVGAAISAAIGGFVVFAFSMVIVLVAGSRFGSWNGTLAVAVAYVFSSADANPNAGFFAGIVVAGGIGAYAVGRFRSLAVEKNRVGTLWLAFWPFAVGLCYLMLWAEGAGGGSHAGMLLLVMLGLVPLVNIPFDWASIGVTRALLRRGCEQDAPSPFLLGVADFLLGLLLLALLAVALLTALLAADRITGHAGTAPLIDLPRLFHRMAATPEDPANWWVYLTLFSTLIPSVLNCLIGAVSLISWSLPSLRRWMLDVIPKFGESGWDRTRRLVMLALGGQIFVGTLLTGGVFWGAARLIQVMAPLALSDLLASAEAWVRVLSGTG